MNLTKRLSLFFICLLLACCGYSTNRKRQTVQYDSGFYALSADTVGELNRGVRLYELFKLFPGSLLKKRVVSGEYPADLYDSYRVFNVERQHLYTVIPEKRNDEHAEISEIRVVHPRFRTKLGVGPAATYRLLRASYRIKRITPDINHIWLVVPELSARISISKKSLLSGWWDPVNRRVREERIPADARFEHYLVDWSDNSR